MSTVHAHSAWPDIETMPRHWRSVTESPNSREAHVFRDVVLRNARKQPVQSRNVYLANIARGRTVLDVGVADHHVGAMFNSSFLHRDIAAASAYCLGVDILPDVVERLQQEGFNVSLCDITREDPGERFELMIVGEVIEHLGAPEALFDAAKRILTPRGRIVITTPNPFYLVRIRDFLWGQERTNVDHVTWFTPSGIAELADRNGFVLESYRGVLPYETAGVARRLKLAIARRMFAEDASCYTTIYECRLR